MGVIIKRYLSNRIIVLSIIVLFVVLAGLQAMLLKPMTVKGEDKVERLYKRYNNYVIFKESFHHLKNGKDLYVLHQDEHFDLYKYSPTFSVFFGFFAIFPDWFGLSLWNLLNALVFSLAIYYLPKIPNDQKGLILIVCLIELMTSMQNQQSNALIAGLLILSFGLLERDKSFWAILCIMLTIYIKLFGALGFVLLIFYPNKWKSILYGIFWFIALYLLPFIYISVQQYTALCLSWRDMLAHDHSASLGLSVMGWLHSWFNFRINKALVVAFGLLCFSLPFYKFSEYKNYRFKLLSLASILLWIVIFNHKAESPTFIIALAGAAIWYVSGERNKINTTLFVLAFIFTSLSPTDVFPRAIRVNYVVPYVLKAVPCILIWFKMIYDLVAREVKPLEFELEDKPKIVI